MAQKGYTLLEVMVVVSILGVVLIPVSVFFQEYINRLSSENLLINHQLAKNMMEKILAEKDYNDFDTTIVVGQRAFDVKTVCKRKGDLTYITVTSNRSKVKDKPVTLDRYVYLKENE